MVTCRSASRTYQCNEYGHWERVRSPEGNVMKRRKRKNREFPRNGEGEEDGEKEEKENNRKDKEDKGRRKKQVREGYFNVFHI